MDGVSLGCFSVGAIINNKIKTDFLFGGSDIVMLFQKGTEVEIVHNGGHLLMGEAYARLK